nr:PREDICTED: piggyBac transposable element-derived protein 4-like [Pundamilia nyererei]
MGRVEPTWGCSCSPACTGPRERPARACGTPRAAGPCSEPRCRSRPFEPTRARCASTTERPDEPGEARAAAASAIATTNWPPIRAVWDEWCARLPAMYRPGREVTVDERLVPFRGRCPFRQYMPSKPARYEIKIWVACDARSSYAWKMQVLYRERGHTVLGTLRSNRPEIPRELCCVKGRAVGSVESKNKNVLLLTTTPRYHYHHHHHRHRSGPEPRPSRRISNSISNGSSSSSSRSSGSNRSSAKPPLVLHYNRTKGGVDNLDKVVSTYSCRRKTRRWPVALFHNMVDVAAYNAFVLWREIHPDWMPGKLNKRRLFLERLGKALARPMLEARVSKDVKTKILCHECRVHMCTNCAVTYCPNCAASSRTAAPQTPPTA